MMPHRDASWRERETGIPETADRRQGDYHDTMVSAPVGSEPHILQYLPGLRCNSATVVNKDRR